MENSVQENQSEALRLADVLDQIGGQFPLEVKISKELRRLHEINTELTDTVEDCLSLLKAIGRTTGGTYEAAMRTFIKATKEQNAKH